jgi:UDP-N-acetylmuramate dehydrogenase
MLNIKENLDLKNFCTFRIGGQAKYFAMPKSVDELKEAIQLAKDKSLPVLAVGGGSNLLFPDQDLDALVIRVAIQGIEQLDETHIKVGAGTNWVQLLKYCEQNQLYGLEAFSGLPGLIGGAVYGNAGAHDVEMKDVITEIEALNINTMQIETVSPAQYLAEYRHSSFKHNKHLIILNCTIQLSKDQSHNTGSPEDFSNFRKQNQPQGLTTGSFFKNPPNNFAGKLIEEVGLKGYQIGDITTSDKHANFFLNLGHGTAAQVEELKNHIIQEVKNQKQVQLEPEVQIIDINQLPRA